MTVLHRRTVPCGGRLPVMAIVPVILATTALAQTAKLRNPQPSAWIELDSATRIADPKLSGGGIELAFHAEPPGVSVPAVAEILQGGAVLATVWSGTLSGGTTPTQVSWDGREAGGDWCDTGDYLIRVTGTGVATVEAPLSIVRLGITEIEAQDSPAGDDEWQMVYFRKNTAYSFYATPAIHEYVNVRVGFEVSDLDLDDGEARPIVSVHTQTDAPVMNGSEYGTTTYNYPVAYIMGSTPRFELTFGDSGTSSAGVTMPAGYPVFGFDIRAVAEQDGASSVTGPITPGGTALVDLQPLANDVRREDIDVTYSWQYSPVGDSSWYDIPGSTVIPVRVYTILDEPNFQAGASGTQYAGPWVEVAEYISSWKDTLGFASNDDVTLTEVHVQGFFGQNGGIPTAIEGVIYDAYPLGGDGGATHYFSFGSWKMRLTRLLNGHANGIYVNCSDNMGATTTMLAMMGVDNMRPVRLGNMSLKAIWGIGSPAYTTDLWGGGHSFSYHHIVTNDDRATVSDTCMQLDEDGDPDNTPGIPGWNHHRPWSGVGVGYNNLSSYNNTSTELESLPGLL